MNQLICSITHTNRRFSCEQDRDYRPEQKFNGEWMNTKVISLPRWTVYEFVGSPSYQTPVFTGSESECREWLKNI